MKWQSNMSRKLREIEKETERELINKYLFGVPALTKKKNTLLFAFLTIIAPGFLICALPELKKYFPFLQDKRNIFIIIFSIGMVFGLLARGFLKMLSECWKDVLSNFMKQKPEFSRTPPLPFNSQKILEENHTWVVGAYFFTLWAVFSGAVDIEYNSVAFTLSRSVKNSIIPLIGLIFFAFGWGLVNLWMILKIECVFSSVD